MLPILLPVLLIYLKTVAIMQHSTVKISVSFKVRMCKYLGIYALTRKRLFIKEHLLYNHSSCFHQKRPPDVFCKKGVLRNFTKFTGKHLCQSLFFNSVAGLRHYSALYCLHPSCAIKICWKRNRVFTISNSYYAVPLYKMLLPSKSHFDMNVLL